MWLWQKIKTFLVVYYAYMVEYRAELLFWVLSGSLPIILMGVWIEAAQGGQFMLDSLTFARYFIMVFIVRQFTLVWVIWEFEKEVVQGKLSLKLLQPIDPVWHHVAAHLSERLARLPFVVALIVLFFWLYPQAMWRMSVGQIVLGCLATGLAFSLRFLLQYTLAILAFWTERASALEDLFFLFYLFLSGYLAPLEVFPPLMQEIAQWTPFPYLLYFPVALFVGLPVSVGRGFLTLLVWGVVLLILNRWLWRKGLRKYSGMGA
ncbi:ABC-2 family transporter protein [Spirulina subsalsa FACHB-351]|uniref:ABC-2 family transporter protein n=1 Tax=Spirulina subsalsa FACHB-351 TaxID=234711 RepID=A0ABT3LD21_9CYAN|nr:ABC-2 family transporter protein [Spirulina subsalsa]MCW6039009.1 ABC-2 family transporter protein [Spirulina subsalsa FACHB-351]